VISQSHQAEDESINRYDATLPDEIIQRLYTLADLLVAIGRRKLTYQIVSKHAQM